MVVGDVSTQTDVLVIGAGPGGYVAAIRAAQHGREVTLVERDALGGTCLNYGCIPSKALITGADIANRARGAENIGISADIDVDLETMVGWKDDVVGKLTGGVEALCKQHGITIMEGLAVFADDSSVRLIHEGQGEGAETIDFDQAVIATGSRPLEVPGFDFGDEHILDSRQLLALETIPDKLVVIGAGYIGMELSTAFSKLGADVTVVEMLDDVLPGYQSDVARVVRERAVESGVDFHFGHAADGYEEAEDGVLVNTETEDGETASFAADKVLVAVGREPVTDTVEVDAAGIETDDGGFIPTDEHCQTDVEDIYAIGDVAGEPMLAHKAMYEGKIAAEVIAGEPAGLDARSVPAVVFTDPEIATVGMTEDDASEAGFEPVVGQTALRANGRSLTLDEEEGFVRVIADQSHDTILGAQIVAPEASELVGELTLAVESGATLTDVAGSIHTHPTLSEAIAEAVENALGEAIHTIN